MSSFKKIVVLFVLIALAMTTSIGPKSGLPMGNAIDANWSLPCSLRSRWSEMVFSLLMALSSVRILSHLVVGSSMVNAMPSSTHPRISFLVSHVPSAISFFKLIGGPMLLPVVAGEGKMSEIVFSRLLVSCLI